MPLDNVVYALPGTMCDEKVWSILREKDLNFTIVHIDIPQESSISKIVEALEDILPKEPVQLLGFSLGGYIASAFTVLNNERVEKLAILSNSPTVLPEQETNQRKQLIRWVKKNGYSGITQSKVKLLLHEKNANERELIQLIMDMDSACGAKILLQQLQATTERTDLSVPLSATNKNLGYFYGEQDKLIDIEKIEALSNVFTNIGATCISGAGHMLPLEAPQQLSNSLNDFFKIDRLSEFNLFSIKQSN